MLIEETELVRKCDTRSDRQKCGYCSSALGQPHEPKCVCRRKLVVVRATVEYIVSVPAAWDARSIWSARNESSWCKDNMLDELDAASKDGCLCRHVHFDYLRDATDTDTETMLVAYRGETTPRVTTA